MAERDARFAPPKAIVEHAGDDSGLPRLHRVTSVAIAVALGGALAGGYLVVRNLVALGRPHRAWLAAGLFGAMFLSTVLVQLRWPASFFVAQLVVGLPRLAVATAIAWLLQWRFLRAHKRAQGRFRSR